MSKEEDKEDGDSKRTRLDTDLEPTEPISASEVPTPKEPPSWLSQQAPPAWLTPSSAPPSWLSPPPQSSEDTTKALPSWSSKPSTSVPDWLIGASTSTTTSSNPVPSWLNQSEPAATFGSLSNSASVFGAPKEQPADDAEESSGGEEESETAAADATFGGGLEEPATAPPEIPSGEEHEHVLLQLRVKLFKLVKSEDASASWSEMGFGPLRVNTDNESLKSRLIMRRQGVWTLLLNAPITCELTAQRVGDKMIRLVCTNAAAALDVEESNRMMPFLVKCSREEDREALVQCIEGLIPSSVSGAPTPTLNGASTDSPDK